MKNFLDEETIKKSEAEIIEREKNFGGDKREKMIPGSYKPILCKIELEVDQKGVPMVKIICNVDESQATFRDLEKVFRFDEANQEKMHINQKMFIEFFYKAFGHTFKPGDLKSIIAQIKKYEKQRFSATVQVRQRMMKRYVKDENGKDTTEVKGYYLFDQAQLYFVGKANEELMLKPEKKFMKLKENELQVYLDHKEEFPERYDDTGRLKFDNKKEENTEEAKEKSINSSQPEENKNENKISPTTEVDDLPWQ